jgi:hypothetical protein
MGNASFVTHSFDLMYLSIFVMNAIMGHSKEDVSFVALLVFQMHIIVANALYKRKMYVLKHSLSFSYLLLHVYNIITLSNITYFLYREMAVRRS